MSDETRDAAIAAMEPEVGATYAYLGKEASLASIAISLKRIADALTGTGPNILTTPIKSYGEGIGEAIQGQMARGQRGIDQYEGR